MALVSDSTSGRKTIGVFISRIGRMWEPEFLLGVTDAANAQDLNVICFAGGRPTAIINTGKKQLSYGLYDIARAEQLAGIIVSGDLGYGLGEEEFSQFLKNYSHLPLVVNAFDAGGVPNLIGDDLQGMRAVIRHLIEAHDCKNIAFISGSKGQIEAEKRLLAYKLELEAHHLQFDERLVIPGDFSLESGRAAIGMLLDERKVVVDAIAAANDQMAIGAFEALHMRGIDVPGSIALTGYGDIREARELAVPLTTVCRSAYDMGSQSVQLLQLRIGGQELPESRILPTRLVVRDSCGCLPGSLRVVSEERDIFRAGQLGGKRDAVVLDLLADAGLDLDDSQASDFRQSGGQTWEALLKVIRGEDSLELFLQALEVLFSSMASFDDDISTWHNLVSTLRRHALAGLRDEEKTRRAESLFHQARIFIGELNQRFLALKRMNTERLEQTLQAFSFSMAPAMSLEEIGAAMRRHFPDLGIKHLYVMIYSNVTTPESTLEPPSENFHLLLQYDESGFQLPADRPKWGTGRLIPRGLTPQNRRYAAMVMPLALAQNRFGFLWVEINTREWEVFVRIRNLVSSALLRTMLVEQRALIQRQVEHLLDESQLRAKELAAANEKAERTAEEIARLYNQEHARRKNAEALSNSVHKLSTVIKLNELPWLILDQLENLIPFDHGILLLEELNGTTRVAGQKGFPQETSEENLLDLVGNSGAYKLIVEGNSPAILEDITAGSGWKPVEEMPVDHSWMCIPLFSKNKLTGMLAASRQPAANFTEDELLLGTMFGIQAAISIENARLYDGMERFNELLERMVSQRVEELNKAYNKLEKLDKFKTSFIQVTAHELRTPITVMKGYLSMLKEDPAIQENGSLLTVVDGFQVGTNRLHQIVNSMLDLARLEEQAMTPHIETVVVGLVFRRIESEYQADLAGRNITLQYEDGVSSLPFIQADPQLLQKALDALFVNAIKFTPDGGTIHLGGQAVGDDELGPCLDIHVRDTGIGIDPADQQVIFEKLFQLGQVELHSSGRTKYKGGGPGLGLAIAASITKAHHGRIWVESPGHDEEKFPGSTFFIRLPLGRKS